MVSHVEFSIPFILSQCVLLLFHFTLSRRDSVWFVNLTKSCLSPETDGRRTRIVKNSEGLFVYCMCFQDVILGWSHVPRALLMIVAASWYCNKIWISRGWFMKFWVLGIHAPLQALKWRWFIPLIPRFYKCRIASINSRDSYNDLF